MIFLCCNPRYGLDSESVNNTETTRSDTHKRFDTAMLCWLSPFTTIPRIIGREGFKACACERNQVQSGGGNTRPHIEEGGNEEDALEGGGEEDGIEGGGQEN